MFLSKCRINPTVIFWRCTTHLAKVGRVGLRDAHARLPLWLAVLKETFFAAVTAVTALTVTTCLAKSTEGLIIRSMGMCDAVCVIVCGTACGRVWYVRMQWGTADIRVSVHKGELCGYPMLYSLIVCFGFESAWARGSTSGQPVFMLDGL